jgi:diacylglycerol kinase family enzyme
MRARVILNVSGGTAAGQDAGELEEQVRDGLTRLGVKADVRAVGPDAISQAMRDGASAPDVDVLVAGGGDGTISSAAGHLAGTGRPLGILPLGTLNHLARDAGIPTDLDAALAIIARGHVRPVDVAEVNGRVFVNNSSVGLYPSMVRLREVERERTGRSKRLAMLSASMHSLRSFRRHRLWISTQGFDVPVRTPLLFVGNNRYSVNLLALGTRDTLDGGELCLYAIRARSRAHLLWAGLRGVFGRLEQQRDFVTAYVQEAEISSDRAALIVSADGETVQMRTPLRYRIRPGALKLIVPEKAD